jgi:hypothetical protein
MSYIQAKKINFYENRLLFLYNDKQKSQKQSKSKRLPTDKSNQLPS